MGNHRSSAPRTVAAIKTGQIGDALAARCLLIMLSKLVSLRRKQMLTRSDFGHSHAVVMPDVRIQEESKVRHDASNEPPLVFEW